MSWRILLASMYSFLIVACTDYESSYHAFQDTNTQMTEASILRPGNRFGSKFQDAYLDEIQPVLAQRCVGCHSCTNAPCQLNMTSYAALARGVSSVNPYDFGLFEKRPTRVSDNRSLEDWRADGFHGVLPEPGTNPEQSLFARSLELGRRNTLSLQDGESPLTLSTLRSMAQAQVKAKAVCPLHEKDYSKLVKKYPLGGMPWGLPVVEADHLILENWVKGGAAGPSATAQQILTQPQITDHTVIDPYTIIASWEAFLDAPDLKSQLVARYIYEHVASANIHFQENPGEFYRLVRSKVGAPAPIIRIQTDTPQDDPGYVGRVHYRLEKIDRVIEGKTHVPWNVSLQTLERLNKLFLTDDWTIKRLPDYRSKNPFEIFDAIPAQARSRFMLENSQMIYATFARGPICLLQMATYAVDEYFWIWFIKPESDPTVLNPKLGLKNYDSFFNKDGNVLSGVPVLGNKYGEPLYREAFERELRRLKPEGLGLRDLWNGDGENPNAWLTVHRNQFSVDVHTTWERPTTGLPHSYWLMTYANFERMFYNAVTQYKYWGHLRHQNDSFTWQILTRTEAEDLYASLFPDPAYRQQLRSRFTTEAARSYYKLGKIYSEGRPSASPDIQTEEAMAMAFAQSLGQAFGPKDRLNHWPDTDLPTFLPDAVTSHDDFEAGLRYVTARSQAFGRFVPNVVHVRLGADTLYTLLAVRGYRPDKISIREKQARAPELDRVVAVPGFSAFEAHMFVDLNHENAVDFLRDLAAVKDQASWNSVASRYKVARNGAQFWPFVDWLHSWLSRHEPVRGGILELRAYDMDETPF